MENQLITQEKFVEALTNGIAIPAENNIDVFDFGERLIRWINSTDNIYWAAWDPENENRVLVDLRNCELMQLWIIPGRVLFRRVEKDVEHDMAKEFGNGAIGIMLFCMLENEEIEEFDLEMLAKEEEPQKSKSDASNEDECPDFEWI